MAIFSAHHIVMDGDYSWREIVEALQWDDKSHTILAYMRF
eukprot:SAG11_NODE_92_length_17132_cov_10.277285_18_plen_40_part_00